MNNWVCPTGGLYASETSESLLIRHKKQTKLSGWIVILLEIKTFTHLIVARCIFWHLSSKRLTIKWTMSRRDSLASCVICHNIDLIWILCSYLVELFDLVESCRQGRGCCFTTSCLWCSCWRSHLNVVNRFWTLFTCSWSAWFWRAVPIIVVMVKWTMLWSLTHCSLTSQTSDRINIRLICVYALKLLFFGAKRWLIYKARSLSH